LLLVPIVWGCVRARGATRIVAGGCALLLAAAASTGGDHFQFCRLAVPIAPVASVLAASLLCSLRRPLQVGLVGLLLLQAPVGWKRHGWRAVHSGTYLEHTEAVARAMQRLPDGPIATLGIGLLGYRCLERSVIDLVGLADAHIARTPHVVGAASGHDHSDPEYVMDQRPAIVLPNILTTEKPLGDAEELASLDAHWYQSGLDLLRNARFRAGYVPVNLALDNGRFIRIWARRDLSLSAATDLIVP